MFRVTTAALVAIALTVAFAATATADEIKTLEFEEASGLSATAKFSFTGSSSSTLTIVLTNTSTGTPSGSDSVDQLLTSISFELPGVITISGGSAAITSGSDSVDFDNVSSQLTGGDDVSVEFGYGNAGATGLSTHYVSSNTSGATAFQSVDATHPNLDGPNTLNGPQPGLYSSNSGLALGGNAAIDNSVTFTLNLSSAISDFDWLSDNVIIEYGSDAAFLTPVPEPGTMLLLGLGVTGLGFVRRRRRN